jgi:CubicO group peptidase (beta-lactamase class C family)
MMQRRSFIQASLATMLGTPLLAAFKQDAWDEAAAVLAGATESGQVASATLYVSQQGREQSWAFGNVQNEHAMFLLGSISKPVAITSLMTLFDKGAFQLADPVKKFIPAFSGEGRENVTMRHLLTHVSGLPDQLKDNDLLRKQHAPLSTFVEHAIRTPLEFTPGSQYQYSSMAILLASHVAELISGEEIRKFVDRVVLQPLGMAHSAQGLGRFTLDQMVPMQTEYAAVEAGGGDPTAKDWDWNSLYWRELGAPWGGTHASAPDIGKFLAEFLFEEGKVVRPETAKLMVINQNPMGLESRGIAFDVGASLGGEGCSENVFGHTGSTGTIAWADPQSKTICVVLTSLPARAVKPHPRDLATRAIMNALSMNP